MLNSFQTSGNSPGATRCHVGILGFGTVGSVLARRLTGSDSIPLLELTHIRDRRARDKRARQARPLERLQWPGRGDATAVALIGDLLAIARDRAVIVPASALSEPDTIERLSDQKLAEAV